MLKINFFLFLFWNQDRFKSIFLFDVSIIFQWVEICPKNNFLSVSKKVKGSQSDSRLEKKGNEQTTEKISASAENSLSVLGRNFNDLKDEKTYSCFYVNSTLTYYFHRELEH